jgi:hypothetical protein
MHPASPPPRMSTSALMTSAISSRAMVISSCPRFDQILYVRSHGDRVLLIHRVPVGHGPPVPPHHKAALAAEDVGISPHYFLDPLAFELTLAEFALFAQCI